MKQTVDYLHCYSLSEALKALDAKRPKHAPDYSETNGGDFAGAKSFKEAVEAAHIGDMKLLTKLEAEASKMQASGLKDAVGLSRVTDVTGCMVLVDEYCAGNQECMVDFHLIPEPRKVVHFVVQIDVNCSISHETLSRRGAAIYTAIRALELQGYSTGITACISADGKSSYSGIHAVDIKKPGEYLDPAVAAYWIADSTAFRRCGFKLMEQVPDDKERENMRVTEWGGYGHTRNLTKEDVTSCLGYDRFLLLPNDGVRNGKTLEDWLQYVLKKLEKMGITIN